MSKRIKQNQSNPRAFSLKSKSSFISVSTLVNNPSKAVPLENAYAFAKYSRKPLDQSLRDILQELEDKNVDSGQRIHNIVFGYGHKSPAELAGCLSCSLENIPILQALYFHYNNSIYASQETSTRYINFKEADYYIPSELNKTSKELYIDCVEYSLQCYRELQSITESYLTELYTPENKSHKANIKKRSFDCVRGFIPLSINTSLGVSANPYTWSRDISRLLSSPLETEKESGKLLLKLLTEQESKSNYYPECDMLIKHVEPSKTYNIESKIINEARRIGLIHKDYSIDLKDGSLNCSVVNHSYPSTNRYANIAGVTFTLNSREDFEDYLGDKLFNNFNRHKELPIPLHKSNIISIRGRMDIGSFKDLNRHRSLVRFSPQLHYGYNWKNLINKLEFYIPQYLNGDIISQYKDKLSLYKSKLIKFYLSLEDDQNYLFPLALNHSSIIDYVIEGDEHSLAYTVDLRTRPGAHISYDQICRNWVTTIINSPKENSITPVKYWTNVYAKLSLENPLSKEWFYQRS